MNSAISDNKVLVSQAQTKNKHEVWVEKVMNAHIPTHLRIKTLNASAGRIFESSLPKAICYGYKDLGYDLGSSVYQYTDEGAFDELLNVWDDEAKTAKWLHRHMNHFFRLIPSRKRSLFVEGFEERGCLG